MAIKEFNRRRYWAAVILVGILILIANLTPVSKHGYPLSLGWDRPHLNAQTALYATCVRPLSTDGYPFADQRYYKNSCLESRDNFAFSLNLLTVLAIVIIVRRLLKVNTTKARHE